MTLPCASTVPLRMSELTNINEPILRIYPTTHTNEDHYYKPDVEALLQWLLSMPSGEAEACSILLRQRAIEMLRRHKHAIFLELWEKLVLTKYDPIFISLRTALCRALVHFSGLHEDTTISLVLEGAIQSKGPHGVWIVSRESISL
ncbi:hypothetical protein C8Q79DRAFT_167685 [Trametes meyenii]|nr:hypothetical protein C8Q79DRAFT_167685 [Trametes meyenii]